MTFNVAVASNAPSPPPSYLPTAYLHNVRAGEDW